jgi:hypothetical protein
MVSLHMLTPQLEQRILYILNELKSDKIGINDVIRPLLWEIDKQNVEGVMSIVPALVRDALRGEAGAMPRTEAEWSEWHDVFLLCAQWDRKLTREEIERQRLDYEQRTRRGIEALRVYFSMG